MVQEQVARLRFALAKLPRGGRSVLDLGCGSGYVLDYVIRSGAPDFAMGVDIDPDIVAFAKNRYPGVRFEVGDAGDPRLELGRRFDRIFSFEVLEHVADQGSCLFNIARHLARDGTSIISTPNRTVFSLGAATSVHNPTHRRELTMEEFHALLVRYFGKVDIWGQFFVRRKLQRAYNRNTRHLIRRRRMRRSLEERFGPRSLVLRGYYKLEDFHDRLRSRYSRLSRTRWDDFCFARERLPSAIWFLASVAQPKTA